MKKYASGGWVCALAVIGLFVFFFSFTGTARAASVSSFVIGGFDTSRGGLYSFPAGDYLDQARASIVNNFPGASFASFATLTPDGLAGVDILAISSATTNVSHFLPLAASEQSALYDFVLNGGCAILFPDNSTFGGVGTPAANESLIDPFGLDIAGTLIGGQTALVIDPSASSITSGPFGTISSFSQNYPGGLTNVGPYATPLATNPLGYALAAIDSGVISMGSGRVVIYTDINSFGDTDAAGFFPENEALFLNTVNYCVESVPLEVSIDIKPGSDPNCFNQNEHGAIPVAIFGSADVNVGDIVLNSLSLQGLSVKVAGKSDNVLAHYDYVNGDSYLDLVVQFADSDAWIEPGDDYAVLLGTLSDGTPIGGSDSICIVP